MKVIFLLAAFVTLLSAMMVVSVRKMMHAALWLVVSLLGVAVLMALLESRFMAVVQVLVYIGAIAILIIVGVMLTRRFMDDDQPQLIRHWGWAGLAVVLLLGGLIYTLRFFPGFETITRTVPAGGENIAEFGMALVDPNGFVVPFEVASILLLAAMIGAIFVAIERKERA